MPKGSIAGVRAGNADLQREEHRIKIAGNCCSFDDTQKSRQGARSTRKADRPWVLYLYGQIHLARAAAPGRVGLQQQLSELDQAIARFRDSRS